MKPNAILKAPAALAAMLMASCAAPRPAPPASAQAVPARPPTRVVFVHGIFQSGRVFGPLARRLEAEGCECLIPKLTPADARHGLEPMAAQLGAAIDRRWGDAEKVHIVAHSMGGLISREYLQHMGGHRRCMSLTTLATPHHGTLAAWFYPGRGAVQMRCGSAFLTDLAATEKRLDGIPLHSYFTPMDLIILPYTSSKWDIAENESVSAPAHPLVMFSPRVVRHLLRLTGTTTQPSTLPPAG